MEAKQDVSWSGVRAYDGSLNLDGSDCSGNADDVLGAAWSFAASRQHIVEPLHCLHELIENEMGARLLMRSGLSLKNMHSLKALVAEELDLLKDNGVNDTSCTGVYIAYVLLILLRSRLPGARGRPPAQRPRATPRRAATE